MEALHGDDMGAYGRSTLAAELRRPASLMAVLRRTNVDSAGGRRKDNAYGCDVDDGGGWRW